MGKAKRFNAYDDAVYNSRRVVRSFGVERQNVSGSIGSSFGSQAINPPTGTVGTGGTGSGTGDGTFCTASLSADQTTNLSATNHVEFDTLDEDGGITLQTGTGQANGIFELSSGKKYYLSAKLRPEFSGATGQLVVAWYDITNTAEIGSRAIYESQTHASNNANQPAAECIITPTANITIELRIISVTALTALANEYCNANLFEISLGAASGAGGGGGGAVSFPITPDINDHGNVGTTTEDLDLSASNGHIHKITLTGNPTLTFSNPPSSGTQIEFEIEFVQDSTGGRTVTWPASVAETVNISSSAESTTIITLRTNDGGTTYHAIPALRGSITLSGSSAFATPQLDNLSGVAINTDMNFNSYDATNMDRIRFTSSSGAVASAGDPSILLDSVSNMQYNVATAKSHVFTVNNSATIPFSIGATGITAVTIAPLNNSQTLGSSIAEWGGVFSNFFESNAATPAVAGQIRLGNTESIYWRDSGDSTDLGITLNASDALEVNADIDVNTQDIIDIDAIRFDQTAGNAFGSTDTGFKSDAQSDLRSFVPSGSAFGWLEGGTTIAAMDVSANVARFELTDSLGSEILLSESTGSTSLSISRASTGVSLINEPTALSFQINSAELCYFSAEGIDIKEISTPTSPSADRGRLYTKEVGGTHSELFFKDELGTETNVLTGSEVTTWTTDHDANGNSLDNFNELISNATNPAATGSSNKLRLGNQERIAWRNAGNSNDLYLKTTATDGYEIYGDGGLSPPTTSSGTPPLGLSSARWGTLWANSVDLTGTLTVDGNVIIGDDASDSHTVNGDINMKDDVTMGSSGTDLVKMAGGIILKSSSSTEIGFQVSNDSISIGDDGTLQIPHVNGASSTAAQADTDFGDGLGCMGVYTNATSNTHLLVIRQSDGNWSGVILTDNTLV